MATCPHTTLRRRGLGEHMGDGSIVPWIKMDQAKRMDLWPSWLLLALPPEPLFDFTHRDRMGKRASWMAEGFDGVCVVVVVCQGQARRLRCDGHSRSKVPQAWWAKAPTQVPCSFGPEDRSLGRPAPRPAHRADTSDTGGAHFALVRPSSSVLFHTGRRVFTRRCMRDLFDDVSHTRVCTAVGSYHAELVPVERDDAAVRNVYTQRRHHVANHLRRTNHIPVFPRRLPRFAKTYPGGVCRVAGDESSGVRTVMLVAAAVCGERDTIDEQRPCLPTLSI